MSATWRSTNPTTTHQRPHQHLADGAPLLSPGRRRAARRRRHRRAQQRRCADASPCGFACYDLTGSLAGTPHRCTCTPEHCDKSSCEQGGGIFIDNCNTDRPCPCSCPSPSSLDESHAECQPALLAQEVAVNDLAEPTGRPTARARRFARRRLQTGATLATVPFTLCMHVCTDEPVVWGLDDVAHQQPPPVEPAGSCDLFVPLQATVGEPHELNLTTVLGGQKHHWSLLPGHISDEQAAAAVTPWVPRSGFPT